jgi:hypothetical protein
MEGNAIKFTTLDWTLNNLENYIKNDHKINLKEKIMFIIFFNVFCT